MSSVNAVWYAESYHPIQAGSIDGTDVLPHDNAIYRAQLSSSLALYDPFGDPKVMGDPYCTVFVGRIPRHTEEETVKQVMNKYGRVKNMRLVRDIATGASRGYAFVEYETEREMRRAYEDAHHTIIDGNEVLVDYYRQQIMPGWIPRRLGGGLGGKKESGQLRFGGRERPFRAPLRPIPYDELKRLGIPPPPEGHYMSRFKVPSPPRRKKDNRDDYEELSSRHKSQEREDSNSRHKSEDREEDHSLRGKSHDRGYYDTSRHKSYDREDYYSRHNSKDREDYNSRHKSKDREESRSRHNKSKERDKDRKSTRENYRYKREESTHRYEDKGELELEPSYKSNYVDDFWSRERSKDRGSSYHSGYEQYRDCTKRSRDISERSVDSKSGSYNKRRRSQKESEENAYEYSRHQDDY